MEAPITPICRLIAGSALAAALAMPAAAREPGNRDRLTTYVAARAADAQGDPATAARLFADLVRDAPDDNLLRRRAIAEAIEAGNMKLGLDLARAVPIEQTALDLRLLLVADQLRMGKDARAIDILRTRGGIIDSSFLSPFVEAWIRAGKRDQQATDSLAQVPDSSALAPLRDEHRALILLKLKRPAEAVPLADLALSKAGGRADRLRLAFADGFARAGDKANALKMLDAGDGGALAEGKARLLANKSLDQVIDTPAKAYGEMLLGLSLALSKMQDKSLPVSIAQVARFANPSNSAGTLLLALLLDADNRDDAALAMLRTLGPNDPFTSQAGDAEVRILNASGRKDEALARAKAFGAAAPSADSFSRLGAALSEREQYEESADAYGRALAIGATQPGADQPWALHLFRASALESANRWAEAKAEMAVAMQLSPDNPLLLNFLGYGQLERGENLDAAEAMVRQASALRPDDASITDSLGWAQHKRGRTAEAIATLQRAADGDPAQAEIHEHLGDALYTVGRRIEARFAWRAALVTAEDKAKVRLEAKITTGLTTANASP
ncbi:MAG: tetratricopeptide repeat protein [Sphingomicrobium sp.]